MRKLVALFTVMLLATQGIAQTGSARSDSWQDENGGMVETGRLKFTNNLTLDTLVNAAAETTVTDLDLAGVTFLAIQYSATKLTRARLDSVQMQVSNDRTLWTTTVTYTDATTAGVTSQLQYYILPDTSVGYTQGEARMGAWRWARWRVAHGGTDVVGTGDSIAPALRYNLVRQRK